MGPLSLLLLVACDSGHAPLPRGTWALEGASPRIGEVRGELRSDPTGLLISLWGPQWGTGDIPVDAEAQISDDGLTWLSFPIEVGSGSGVATLRLDIPGSTAIMPMSAREGELDLPLALHQGEADGFELEHARYRSSAALERLQAAWEDGRFLVLDEKDRKIGMIAFAQSAPARIEILDETLITHGFVIVRQDMEGPDLILTFPAEPSVQGQEAILRINLPTLLAVLPAAAEPTPLDRWMRLDPGTLLAPERTALRERAVTDAKTAERSFLIGLGRDLARDASRRRKEQGRCPTPAELGGIAPEDPARGSPWLQSIGHNYEIRIETLEAGCGVRIEPLQVQHTQRLALQVDGSGRAVFTDFGEEGD